MPIPRTPAAPGARPMPTGRPHAVRNLIAEAITWYGHRLADDPSNRYPEALLLLGLPAGPCLAVMPTGAAAFFSVLSVILVAGIEVHVGDTRRIPWAASVLAVLAAWVLYLRHPLPVDAWWPLTAYVILMVALPLAWSKRRPGARPRRQSAASAEDVTSKYRKPLAIPQSGRMTEAKRSDGNGFTLTLDIGNGTDSNNLTADWLAKGFATEKAALALGMSRVEDVSERVIARPLTGVGRILIDVFDKSPWRTPIPHPALSGPAPERTSRVPWQIGVDPASAAVVKMSLFSENGDGAHALIVGKTRSGKTVLMHGLMEYLTGCSDVDVWLADVGKGELTGLWSRACKEVTLSTGGREALEEFAALLDALDAERVRRAALSWEEKAALKRIVLVLDEAPQALGPGRERDESVKDLVRYVRHKVEGLIVTAASEGICLVIATQGGTIEYLGSTFIPKNTGNQVLMGMGKGEQSRVLGAGWRSRGIPNLEDPDLAKGRAWVQAAGTGGSQVLGYLLEKESAERVALSRSLGERPERVVLSLSRESAALALPWPVENAPGWPALESTPEAHFWAAVLRSRDGELREILGQYQESAGGRMVRFDFFLPSAKVAVEIDGKAYHSEVDDAERDRQMSKIGIRTVRFPARDVMRDADACVRAVVEAVRHRGEPGQQWPKVPASGGARAVEAYRRLLSAELVPGQHTPTSRAREILRPDDAGSTVYNEIIKEMISAGLLVRVIDLDTKRPLRGKATTFELTKVDALLPV